MRIKSLIFFIVLTPIIFLTTHAIAFLIHEYSHSFAAWIFGFKSNPFALHYGHANWQNIIFLQEINENVDFSSFSAYHPLTAAFIAFAGVGIGNGFLFLICIYALHSKRHSILYYYFYLWLTVMNLGNFITYIPGRTFAGRDDMNEITTFLNISPWWIMIVLGYPVYFSVWYFYSRILPRTYFNLRINAMSQGILLILVTLTIFILFGTAGLEGLSDYGDKTQLIASILIYITPIIIVSCWPMRKWGTQQIDLQS